MVRSDDGGAFAAANNSFLAGGGETGALIRGYNWASSSLGPPEAWPEPLKTAVSFLLNSAGPVCIGWGPNLIALYNDAYLPILGGAHLGIGKPFQELWSDRWEEHGPAVATTMRGEPQLLVDRPVVPPGQSGLPATYYTFSYTPVRIETGEIIGFYCSAAETRSQVKAESALGASEARLQRATLAAGMFAWETDQHTGVTTWGEGTSNILKVSEQELTSQREQGFFFVAESDRARIHDVFHRAVEARSESFHVEFEGVDGRYWRAESALVYSDDGDLERVMGLTRDITAEYQRSRHDSYLLELESRLRGASTAEDAMNAAAQLLGRELHADRVTYADVDEDIGEVRVGAEYLADDVPSALGRYAIQRDDPLMVAYRTGEPLVIEDNRQDPRTSRLAQRDDIVATAARGVLDVPLLRDGRLVGVLSVNSTSPRRWTQAEIEMVSATGARTWSTTERARAERALRASEAAARFALHELEALYNAAPVGLAVIDRDFRYVRINELLAEVNGLPASEHVGKTIRDVLPGFADQAEEALRRVLGGEEVWNLDLTGETPATPGIIRTWRENWIPLRDEAGKVVAVAISAMEVTEEKEVEVRLREAEQRYRTVFEQAGVGVARVSADGPFLEVNDRYCEILGRSREEILGGGWKEITHPDDVAMDAAQVARIASGEINSYSLEKRYIGKDGGSIWVNLTVAAERDRDGKVLFYIPVVEDIGERKAAEQALMASEERYRALFVSMEQGFCVVRVDFNETGEATDYRFVEINPAFSVHTGLPQDVLNRSVRDAVPGLESVWFERYGEIARTGQSQRFVDHAEPLGRSFEVYGFRLGSPEDRNVAILFSDITERLQHEEALRRSEEDFRLRLNAIPQMVWSTRPDGFHDFFNDRWYEFTGVPSGSTDGAGWNDMFHPEDQEHSWRVWRQSLESGEPYEVEYRLRHRSGEYRWVLGRALPVRSADGSIVRWMGTCTDIADLKAAEQALKDSEARLRAVIEAAPVGLVFADANGAITGGNSRVEQIVGHPVLPSADIDSYKEWVAFHSDGRQVEGREYPLARVLADGVDSAELEVEYQRGDGSRRWIRFSAAPVRDGAQSIIGGVVASIDIDREKRLTEGLEREVERVIAEREAAQEALRQSQKLEAMGQLTGGVAHDFNNLLTPIIGGLDLLHRKNIADARTQRLIEGALQSAEKAKVLVQRLLAFARRQPLQAMAIDVGRIVDGMADLIGSTSGPRVRLEVVIEPDLPPALADGNQLEMALLNLSVNARDAMPDGGSLTIAVRSDVATRGNRLGLREATYVVLSVTDSGVGMDEETQRRAIEPFFSTKGIGKGTGLGLSMVHGLAAQLGGALKINSRPGLGTSIELWLPVADGEAEQRVVPSTDLFTRGAGVALLVDDEELVRVTTATMLSELGYQVVEARAAEEALQHVGAGLRPALLVTDHLMPGMTGTDMALRLRERMPNLPVLIVSGYAEVESLAGSLPHLTKPFRQEDLAASLRALNTGARLKGD